MRPEIAGESRQSWARNLVENVTRKISLLGERTRIFVRTLAIGIKFRFRRIKYEICFRLCHAASTCSFSEKKRELTNEGDRVGGGRRGKRGMGGKYTEEHGRTNGGAVTNCKLIGRIYIS